MSDPCKYCGSRWAEHGEWQHTPRWLRWLGFKAYRRERISERQDLVSNYWEYSDAP